MFEVKLLDSRTQKSFIKTFESPYLLEKFLYKVRKGNKLKVISTGKNY